ncbi:hypothetical protein FQN50_004278 [Emmonsiellopsis sp. PD_5]|nr:hypothetical protein FQN50_004278 [Emmonsiellopsis sp. PD_5]
MASRQFASLPPREGSALTWITEHYLSQPESYEIPLRTMYALNSTAGAHPPFSPLPPHPTSPLFSREPDGNAFPHPRYPMAKEQDHAAYRVSSTAALFKAHLMSQMSQLPTQQCSLPPSFITSFVRRCFPEDLGAVDFPQALTALDYLRDLEQRRNKEVMAALNKLAVLDDGFDQNDLAKRYPGVAKWLASLEEKTIHASALYSKVYLELRYWTLFNEILLPPFNKAQSVAMLNTLFPAVISSRPAFHVCERKLMQERHRFFQYICEVEEKGPRVLDPVIRKDRRPGDATGWPKVYESLNKYLCAVTDIIDACYSVNSRESLEEQSSSRRHNKGRKVDSGISFGSTDHRPSTSSSGSGSASGSSSNGGTTKNKPLPPSPTTTKSSKSSKSSGPSTLERIGRELRKMRSRGDFGSSDQGQQQQTQHQQQQTQPQLKTSRSRGALRKMRSTSILGERDRNLGSSGAGEGEFDAAEFRRKRMLWEAKHNRSVDEGNGNGNGNGIKRSSA